MKLCRKESWQEGREAVLKIALELANLSYTKINFLQGVKILLLLLLLFANKFILSLLKDLLAGSRGKEKDKMKNRAFLLVLGIVVFLMAVGSCVSAVTPTPAATPTPTTTATPVPTATAEPTPTPEPTQAVETPQPTIVVSIWEIARRGELEDYGLRAEILFSRMKEEELSPCGFPLPGFIVPSHEFPFSKAIRVDLTEEMAEVMLREWVKSSDPILRTICDGDQMYAISAPKKEQVGILLVPVRPSAADPTLLIESGEPTFLPWEEVVKDRSMGMRMVEVQSREHGQVWYLIDEFPRYSLGVIKEGIPYWINLPFQR